MNNIFSFDKPISIYRLIATWIVAEVALIKELNRSLDAPWEFTLVLTALTISMVVNALVTGLIVFKILKVFLEVKATMTSIEQSLGSTGGTKLRNVIFIITESGMALFAIQLVRVAITCLMQFRQYQPDSLKSFKNHVYLSYALTYVVCIHKMLNVIIRSVSFSIPFVFTDDIYCLV